MDPRLPQKIASGRKMTQNLQKTIQTTQLWKRRERLLNRIATKEHQGMNQFYVVSLPDIDLLWDESIIGNDRFGEQASGYQTNISLCVDDGNVMSIFSEQEKINHIFPNTFCCQLI